jgi:hypothetical protein
MATAKKTPATKTAKAETGTAVAVKKPSGAIVSIQEQLKAQAAAAANKIGAATGNKIRYSKGKFILPDGTEAESLDVVVVDFASMNSYYEGSYDKDNIVPPNCFAIHPEPKGMVPSANSPDRQCDDCGSCPMNQFGSSGAGKACKNSRLLAVLPPDAEADTPLWLLSVPPTAIKGFDGYVGSVLRTFQMPPVAVVTTVSLDPNEDFFKPMFTDPRPNDNLEVHFARADEAKELLAVEPDVSSFGQDKPAKSKPAARPAARKTATARR